MNGYVSMFNKMRVRLKKEIVSLGIKNINVKRKSLKFIHPSEWNKIIDDKNINIIDVRNPYEIKIGKFKNAINPKRIILGNSQKNSKI